VTNSLTSWFTCL